MRCTFEFGLKKFHANAADVPRSATRSAQPKATLVGQHDSVLHHCSDYDEHQALSCMTFIDYDLDGMALSQPDANGREHVRDDSESADEQLLSSWQM